MKISWCLIDKVTVDLTDMASLDLIAIDSYLRPSSQEARMPHHVPCPRVPFPRLRHLSSWYLDSIHCRRIEFPTK